MDDVLNLMESIHLSNRRPIGSRQPQSKSVKKFTKFKTVLELTSVLFFTMPDPFENGRRRLVKNVRQPFRNMFFIECCSKLLQHSLQIPYLLSFHIQNMQSSTTFRCRGRIKGRHHEGPSAEPSRPGIVTTRIESETDCSQ